MAREEIGLKANAYSCEFVLLFLASSVWIETQPFCIYNASINRIGVCLPRILSGAKIKFIIKT
jgi:hypothetical protein